MSHRPLAIVSGFTIGDYLLWNWSLNGHHDVLALISGLTLPPLTIAFLWLLALTLARLLALTTRRSRTYTTARTQREGRAASRRAVASPPAGALEQSTPSTPSAPAQASTASSRKLAA